MLSYRVIIVITLISIAKSHKNGAPISACNDMVPRHNETAMDLPAPYAIIPIRSVTEEEALTVIIKSTKDAPFKGFLIQARDNSNATIGYFSPTENVQLLNCNSGENNAATHINSADKFNVSLTWKAPNNFNGPVKFYTSIVLLDEIFWVGLTTEEIQISRINA